jgi:transposase
MDYYTGDDAHKEYSVFITMDESGKIGRSERVTHDRETYRKYLRTLPPGVSVAIESVGNWYWMVDEMEKAGLRPLLTNPRKAKQMMGMINKTDKLDAKGLATLNRNGTLPAVWIPPAELRDQRELSRMRMSLTQVRTKFKNRIHATLAKYAIEVDDVSDLFGEKGRLLIKEKIGELPSETRRSVEEQLILLDQVIEQIVRVEDHIREVVKNSPEMTLLKSIPGVGDILAIVIALEIGTTDRFYNANKFASYCGTVPRVNSSGGKTYYGRVRPDVNHYLKWAFIEAANVISANQHRMEGRHAVELLKRIQKRSGHPQAVTAVARHLAESAYIMLRYKTPYREPERPRIVSSNTGVSTRLA